MIIVAIIKTGILKARLQKPQKPEKCLPNRNTVEEQKRQPLEN